MSEPRPVRPELKLHRDAGDDPDGEVEAEDTGPETRCVRVALIAGLQRAPFPEDQEPGQPHGELGKQVVIGDREGELQPMPQRGIAHRPIRLKRSAKCRTVSLSRRALTSLSHPRSIAQPAGSRVEEAPWRGQGSQAWDGAGS